MAPTVVNAPVNVDASEWSPLGEIDYKFTPSVMVYALYSTGFRSAGFSPRAGNNLQVTSFNPDKLVNYESGIKSDWFNNRLRINADVYWMRHSDQQNYKNDCAPCGPPIDSGVFTPWFHAVNAGAHPNLTALSVFNIRQTSSRSAWSHRVSM